ncbi:(deoxy)nucleoside triphosphate pyrophosphohydrolase [Propionibacteriaceae bacterium Y2011]|uniref:(deoxy)nucleoside triphosphate pyrophosphohydrolase n=1 Tax=Microlunatus sp. Y2014 TaxID=3418488 RepID=UPI003B465B6B
MKAGPKKSVVGAAIVRGGEVLTARRTSPATAAGRWEFPGGKVEPGETPESALVREIAEELGCRIRVINWLPDAVAINDTYELRIAVAELVDGDPVPTEHDQIRWLGADELAEVDWLEPDLPFLAALRSTLSGGADGPMAGSAGG